MARQYSHLPAIACCILLLSALPFYAQEISPNFTASLSLPSGEDFPGTDWQEDISYRTEKNALWRHADGRIRMASASRPLHYKSGEGSWKPVSADLRREEDHWLADQQKYTFAVYDDGQVEVRTPGGNWSFGSSSRVGDIVSETHLAELDPRHLIAENIFPGVDRHYQMQENACKTSYIVHSLEPAIIENDFIQEIIQVPEGASLKEDIGHGYHSEGHWYGPLKVISSDGRQIGSIGGFICYDAAQSFCLAGYTWTQLSEKSIEVKMHLPLAWMQDADRSFPLTLDPLITGPLAEWSGEMMNSCVIPEYNTDSILVTIPGEISVTALYVTASFYADPFTTSVMGDGAMFFSTYCDSTETFIVTGGNENLPGTAYLLNFDLRNPIGCCFVPSCTEQNFYLRMHLGRFIPEGDCNALNIYYNPVTEWPFTAYVEGHTVETYSTKWTVSNSPICSNECITDGRMRMRYGVPPYTVTHPWMDGEMSVPFFQENCTPENYYADLPLNVPGCPIYCPPASFTMDVIAATVTDACGNTIFDVPSDVLHIKPAPDIHPPVSELCNDQGYELSASSCGAEAVIYWAGNGQGGTGNFSVNFPNTGSGVYDYFYTFHASMNGCSSDTIEHVFHVMPDPVMSFVIQPDPAMINVPAFFTDQTEMTAESIVSWHWRINGSNDQYGNPTEYLFPSLGWNQACLEIKTENACVYNLCRDFEVVAARLNPPNIFTPNGDGLNEFLEFRNLEFFPENHLSIYNRWGNLVFEEDNYNNNWRGGELAEGTYYFILELKYIEPVAGYFQIVR